MSSADPLASLTSLLVAAQSSVESSRRAAEATLNSLAQSDGAFGVTLVRLVVAHAGTRDPAAVAARLLASILLRHYVEHHWSATDDKFSQPEVSPEAKVAIKTLLPPLLADGSPRIRAAIAAVVAAIASHDWPEEWGELFSLLHSLLRGDDPAGVHGAMRALYEFANDLTGDQAPAAVTALAPELFRIFVEGRHSERTRGRAVAILTILIKMIGVVSSMDRGVVDSVLAPMLPSWVDAFAAALAAPLASDGAGAAGTVGLGIRTDVLRCVGELASDFPALMAPYFRDRLLAPVWSSISACYPEYISSVVRGDGDADVEVDSDGEALGTEGLIVASFQLLHQLCEGAADVRVLVLPALVPLVRMTVHFMQITDEQSDLWSADVDAYVMDEAEESLSFNVRVIAQELIEALSDAHERATVDAVLQVATSAIDEGFAARDAGDEHWWRLHEASLLSIGILADAIKSLSRKGKITFDSGAFIERVLSAYGMNVSPFLIGRVLWFAGCFADAMAGPLVAKFIDFTVGALDPSQPAPVRIAALRAVHRFVAGIEPAALAPFCPRLMLNAIELGPQSTSDVVQLVLDTLARLVKVNPEATLALLDKIMTLVMGFWVAGSEDVFLTSAVAEVIGELASCPGCNSALRERLLPAIINILGTSDKASPAVATALGLLAVLLRHETCPAPADVVAAIFPALFSTVSTTDATEILQNGMECFRSLVRVAAAQLSSTRLPDGTTAVDAVAQVALQHLAPGHSESLAMFACPLVLRIVRSAAPDVASRLLPTLLAAMVQRLALAQMPTFVQSAVVVFAELISARPQDTIDFLASVPLPFPDNSGSASGLEALVRKWIANHKTFAGHSAIRTSSIGLARLLLSGDARIHAISVTEHVISQTKEIMTRSKAKQAPPPQVVSISAIQKICLLLAQELTDVVEGAERAKDGSDDEYEDDDGDDDCGDEDGEDEGWEDADASRGRSRQSPYAPAEDYAHMLSDMPSVGFFDDDDDSVDPTDIENAADDPNGAVVLRGFLEDFFRSFAAHDRQAFEAFVRVLGSDKRHVLAAVEGTGR